MVDDDPRVDASILVTVTERDPFQVLKDRAIHWAIEETAAQLVDAQLLRHRRVRIVRPYAVVRPADHHRRAPRVRPEEPVDRGLLVFAISLVASPLTVAHRLRG